ncbi:MAG: tyrosine-type recombinase/integrase [Pseudomonadales bacterium]|nr:tyrosine-type recombinase/integrase [Pseudomonadales bacterium]
MLSTVFNVAKKDKVIRDAPTDDWEIKQSQLEEPDPYTEAERDALLQALEQWPIAYNYFVMAFHAGMRTGELLGLEWDALEKPYISVHQSRVRGEIKGTKTNKGRCVIAPDEVWDILDKNPTRFRKSFVFLSLDDKPIKTNRWLMKQWQKAHDSSGVRRRIKQYPWRSSYISLALAGGASLIWVSKQAGHNMLTMQTSYARWIKGRVDADLMELNKVYK